MKTPFILIMSAAFIFTAGYWFGVNQAEGPSQQVISELVIDTDKNEKLPALPDVSANPESQQEIELEFVSTQSDSANMTNHNAAEKHPLAELGDAFQRSKHKRNQTESKKVEFDENFSESDADLTAQNQISDFVALHKDAALIELHRLACDDIRCQIIGEYAGEHQGWGMVISEMQETDWWEYSGTSSSSTSKNGKTYFHLFLNK